jgi:hypothetical protein
MQGTETELYPPEIVDVLTQLDAAPSAMSVPWYNAGHFGPVTMEYRRPESLDLIPAEQFVVKIAREYVKRFGQFNMIELGGLVGFGAVRIAYELRDSIENKKVQILVTNYEDEFCVESGLQEAERRLKIFGSFENHRRLMKIAIDSCKERNSFNTVSSIITSNGPMLAQSEIDFLKANSYLVTYLSGIDSRKINTQFNRRVPGFVADLVHERSAGLQLGYPINEPLLSVVEILNRRRGILMTNTDIEHSRFDDAYKKLKSMGIEQITRGMPDDYKAYAYTVAKDILSIELGDNVNR